MPKKTFLRRTWNRYAKLGMGTKEKQKWKRPTGRDNKMREKRRGYPSVVSIGYKTNKKDREKIEGKEIIMVMNLKDLNKLDKDKIALIGKVGNKKKLDLIKVAKEKNIEFQNINPKNFLRKIKLKGAKGINKPYKEEGEKQSEAKE